MNMLALSVALLAFAAGDGVAPADEAPAARAHLNDLLRAIHELHEQLPDIAQAADLAAQRYHAGASLGVRGGPGLASELANRPGGLASFQGSSGQPGDVILYALRSDDDLADALRLKQQGCVVIGITSHDRLTGAQLVCDAVLDHRGSDALTPATVAALAWTWQVEFFAACTRRGLTPVMNKSHDLDYRLARYRRYRDLRFHHLSQVEPIAPGSLGQAYLRKLSDLLRDVGTSSWSELSAAASLAVRAIRTGGHVFVRIGPRYLAHHGAGVFTSLEHDGSNPRLPRPGPADFVIAFGYSDPPGTGYWGEPEMFRDAGLGVCWIASGCVINPHTYVKPGDIWLDPRWPADDALVTVPGYDVRLGSPSGVIAAAIHSCLVAQVGAVLNSTP